jgi:hypothetical protein
MKQIAVFAFIALTTVSSCREIFAKRIRGNGNVTTETKTVSDFNSVDVSGALDIYLRQDSTESVRVEADNNLQQYIEVVQNGDELRIRTKEGFNIRPSRKIKIFVSGPIFKRLQATGASSFVGETPINIANQLSIDLTGASDIELDVTAPSVLVSCTGASTVRMKGEAKDLTLDGSGSTEFKCSGLVSDNVDIDISGASSAEVIANAKLNVKASGACTVKYKGSPATVNQSSSGASSISKIQ